MTFRVSIPTASDFARVQGPERQAGGLGALSSAVTAAATTESARLSDLKGLADVGLGFVSKLIEKTATAEANAAASTLDLDMQRFHNEQVTAGNVRDLQGQLSGFAGQRAEELGKTFTYGHSTEIFNRRVQSSLLSRSRQALNDEVQWNKQQREAQKTLDQTNDIASLAASTARGFDLNRLQESIKHNTARYALEVSSELRDAKTFTADKAAALAFTSAGIRNAYREPPPNAPPEALINAANVGAAQLAQIDKWLATDEAKGLLGTRHSEVVSQLDQQKRGLRVIFDRQRRENEAATASAVKDHAAGLTVSEARMASATPETRAEADATRDTMLGFPLMAVPQQAAAIQDLHATPDLSSGDKTRLRLMTQVHQSTVRILQSKDALAQASQFPGQSVLTEYAPIADWAQVTDEQLLKRHNQARDLAVTYRVPEGSVSVLGNAEQESLQAFLEEATAVEKTRMEARMVQAFGEDTIRVWGDFGVKGGKAARLGSTGALSTMGAPHISAAIHAGQKLIDDNKDMKLKGNNFDVKWGELSKDVYGQNAAASAAAKANLQAFYAQMHSSETVITYDDADIETAFRSVTGVVDWSPSGAWFTSDKKVIPPRIGWTSDNFDDWIAGITPQQIESMGSPLRGRHPMPANELLKLIRSGQGQLINMGFGKYAVQVPIGGHRETVFAEPTVLGDAPRPFLLDFSKAPVGQ